ncbi:MAG TPA: flagellar export chaperone FliS [Bryobacteraceae bacterium]|jgi:flagellar protein FliS
MNEAYRYSSYGNNLAAYLRQKTLSASPLELVAMLYSRGIEEIREARRQLAARDIPLRSRAISKASEIIGELDGSLNMEAGGELSTRLRGLYRYCLVRLLDANLHQSDEPLAEVLGLLTTLSEGWQSIAKVEPAPEKVPTGRWDVQTESTGQTHSWTL